VSETVIRSAILGLPSPMPPVLQRILEQPEWIAVKCISPSSKKVQDVLNQFDVGILVDRDETNPSAPGLSHEDIDARIALFKESKMGAIVFTERPWLFGDSDVRLVSLPCDASVDVARGAMIALAQLRPVIQRIDADMRSLRLLGKKMHVHFEELDHELRLAARLQREFLPRVLPEVGRIRFETFHRPTSFVSGDIFDVLRLDESHLGFYLADAVGHGVAAGLLTMLIKNSIQTKRIYKDGYELVPPAEVMSHLNDHLIAQALPDSQFVTAWYGLLDIESLTLTYCAAGHPRPLLLGPDDRVDELLGQGCLLGVFPDQAYEDQSVQLQPGQRVVLYSDGLEQTLIAERYLGDRLPEFQPGIIATLRKPAEQLIPALLERLDTAPGGLQHADDVSAVFVDVLPDSPTDS
ncbi:MAG: PP2C family protein-serine/threonine phosphatase, partial [Planctomycetota bacterium]|nr:PP2C family protein-serine/threonine phosphatase [Planctomycetota bacterium]